MKRNTSASASSSTLRIGLFDPGMSPMHRVGLAGLWLTLEAIERQHQDIRTALEELGGSWQLDRDHVTLRWLGNGKAYFQRLIREAFRTTPDGRIWFLGLGHPDDHGDLGLTLHEALLNTFLQHGKTRQADPSGEPGGALTIELDGQTIGYRYRRVRTYAHQRDGGAFDPMRASHDVAGWLVPGGAVRHVAFNKQTSLTDPPGPWLALLFAPVGAIYFRVEKRTAGVRPQFCIVLPEVTNLEDYGRARRLFLKNSVRDLIVAGSADAALRVLATLEAGQILHQARAPRCHVFAFGIAPWSPQQKTRMDLFVVERTDTEALRFYRRAEQLLPALYRPSDSSNASSTSDQPSWEISPVLDLIARNIVRRSPWWQDFTSLVANSESWRQLESYRRALQRGIREQTKGGLSALVAQSDAFSQESAEIIVRATQEAWRRRMGALSALAEERGVPAGDLIAREREQLRLNLSHCKNAATLRAILVDFWARSGAPIPELQHGWQVILTFLTRDWQLARDLALLALVSYAGSGEDDNARTTVSQS